MSVQCTCGSLVSGTTWIKAILASRSYWEDPIPITTVSLLGTHPRGMIFSLPRLIPILGGQVSLAEILTLKAHSLLCATLMALETKHDQCSHSGFWDKLNPDNVLSTIMLASSTGTQHSLSHLMQLGNRWDDSNTRRSRLYNVSQT